MSERLFTRFKAALTLKKQPFLDRETFESDSAKSIIIQDLAIYQQFIPEMTSDELESAESVTVLSL